ncbi:MAG: NAD(P)H-binding protein [Pseudomonadota bacterium]
MITILGGTGHIGSAVARDLSRGGYSVKALGRDAQKAESRLPPSVQFQPCDYSDQVSIESALEGAETVVLIPGDGDADRLSADNQRIVGALETAVPDRIVLLSTVDIDQASTFYFTPIYRALEHGLSSLGSEFTSIRTNIFSEFLAEAFILPAIETGEFAVPFGSGKVAPVAKADVAKALADQARNATGSAPRMELHGPREFDGHQLADLASRTAKKAVAYTPVSPADYKTQLSESMSKPWCEAYSTLAQSVSEGRYGLHKPSSEQSVMFGQTAFETVLSAVVDEARS